MKPMTDLHCHILPFVDDGATTRETALELLELERKQGVSHICLTPHLRDGMFETPDEEIQRQFRLLQEAARDLSLELFLSREYHCDGLFWEKLESNALLTMGEGNTILLEFSGRHPFSYLQNAVQHLRRKGYLVLIAHVERYPVLRENPTRAEILRNMGAMLQCNASAILGREGFRAKRFCHTLLKQHLVSVVASDTHDLSLRRPELGPCRDYLVRKFGRDYGEALVSDHPFALLHGGQKTKGAN